jgi:hypothetical protein
MQTEKLTASGGTVVAVRNKLAEKCTGESTSFLKKPTTNAARAAQQRDQHIVGLRRANWIGWPALDRRRPAASNKNSPNS